QQFAFGNPFPTWDAFCSFYVGANVTVQIPGLTPASAPLLIAIAQLPPDDPAWAATGGFAFAAAPSPTAAKVDDHDFRATGVPTLSSLTPTISWVHPSGTKPSNWVVKARQLLDNGQGGTRFGPSLVLTVGPEASEFTFPPG